MAKPIFSRSTGALAAILLTSLVATGCHHRPHHPPGWNQVPPPPSQPLPPAPPQAEAYPTVVDPRPVVIAAPAELPAEPAVRTFTAGCSGGYSLVDAHGRVVRSGRAYNTGAGLVMLDAQGRQGAPVPQPGANQTLLFLPDCACGAGPVQDGPPAAPQSHNPGCPPPRH